MKRLLASLFIAVALAGSASELQPYPVAGDVMSHEDDGSPWVKALLATISPAAVLAVVGAGFSCGARAEENFKGKDI